MGTQGDSNGAAPESTRKGGMPNPGPLRILVVEDEADTREASRTSLKKRKTTL